MSAACRLTIDLSLEPHELEELLQNNRYTTQRVEVIPGPPRIANSVTDTVTKIAKGLQNISEVHFCMRRRRGPHKRFPIAALGALLSIRKDTLISLTVRGGILTGSRDEFDGAYHSLSRATKLKYFTLDSCIIGNAGRPHVPGIDSLLAALNEIKTLEKVAIDDMRPSVTPGSALERLCQTRSEINSTNTSMEFGLNLCNVHLSGTCVQSILGKNSRLTWLELMDVNEFGGDFCDVMANCLQTNTCLKRLQVLSGEEYPITMQSGLKLLRALEEDNTSLRIFHLDVMCNVRFSVFSSPLELAIRNINCLKVLVLDIQDSNLARSLASVSPLLRGLACNRSLVELQLELGGLPYTSTEVQRTIKEEYTDKFNGGLQMGLEKNLFLQEVDITVMDFSSIHLSREVSFWLKLNRAGRRELQNDVRNRRLWLNALIQQKKDPSISFYFISFNPTILLQSEAAHGNNKVGVRPPTSRDDKKRKRHE